MANTFVLAKISTVYCDAFQLEVLPENAHQLDLLGIPRNSYGLVNSSSILTPAPEHYLKWHQGYAVNDICHVYVAEWLDGFSVRDCFWLARRVDVASPQTRLSGFGIWISFGNINDKRGYIRSPVCQKSDILALRKAFSSTLHFKNCEGGSFVRFVAYELRHPFATEQRNICHYEALCVERMDDSEVLAFFGHSEDRQIMLERFKLLHQQILHFESRYSQLDSCSRQFNTILTFCTPMIPMSATFDVPNLHTSGKLLPFRPNSKLTIVGHDTRGHDHTFHADLKNSIGHGLITFDIPTSLHLLRTKVPQRCKKYTLMPYYDSSLAKLELSFLNDYEPWGGQFNRKQEILLRLFGHSPTQNAQDFSPNPPLAIKNDNLNEQQFETVSSVISLRQPIVVVCGPPGVGKSSVIAEVLLHILREDPSSKVLVCCPANRATDNLATTVLHLFQREGVPHQMVRLYARDRETLADPDLAQISLHKFMDKAELPSNSFIDEYETQRVHLLKNVGQLQLMNDSLTPAQQHNLFQSSSQNAKQLKILQTSAEEAYLHDVIKPSIIFSTLASANDDRIQGLTFDYVVIDEI